MGIHVGRLRWPGTRRTVEGSVAGWLASVLTAYWLGAGLSQAVWASAAAMLLEAVTQQNDNTFVAVMLFTGLSVLMPA